MYRFENNNKINLKTVKFQFRHFTESEQIEFELYDYLNYQDIKNKALFIKYSDIEHLSTKNGEFLIKGKTQQVARHLYSIYVTSLGYRVELMIIHETKQIVVIY